MIRIPPRAYDVRGDGNGAVVVCDTPRFQRPSVREYMGKDQFWCRSRRNATPFRTASTAILAAVREEDRERKDGRR